jgi:hypothetical protein
MNVNIPSTHHIPQPGAQTLPLKKNNETGTGATTTTPSLPTPSNPSHLGNSIDTTA